ncbi:hypothetical protein IL992_19355 [Microbispora sp. NEAU-D428]|uniref:ATP-binding protein n=1 Tax=Microbispora sitophila TaxID=2771537 RepID=UPI0018694083|nr:hypothetical protein [Microbispora sitophila]MBE3011336.1 hypothetical protein [Microbispora sitophila]
MDVELRYTPEALELMISDNGPGPSGAEGHGLTGMRERALAVGGGLTACRTPGGGFRIQARLPGKMSE